MRTCCYYASPFMRAHACAHLMRIIFYSHRPTCVLLQTCQFFLGTFFIHFPRHADYIPLDACVGALSRGRSTYVGKRTSMYVLCIAMQENKVYEKFTALLLLLFVDPAYVTKHCIEILAIYLPASRSIIRLFRNCFLSSPLASIFLSMLLPSISLNFSSAFCLDTILFLTIINLVHAFL